MIYGRYCSTFQQQPYIVVKLLVVKSAGFKLPVNTSTPVYSQGTMHAFNPVLYFLSLLSALLFTVPCPYVVSELYQVTTNANPIIPSTASSD